MLIRVNRRPSVTDLRWFAMLFGPAVFVILGLVADQNEASALATALWLASAGLATAGVIAPAATRSVYTALMCTTLPIAWIVSHAIMITIYFGVITPIGWLVRRFHDPMERRFARDATSYWLPRRQSNVHRYFRQF